MKHVLDISAMEAALKLPHWLSPLGKFKGREAIRAKHRAKWLREQGRVAEAEKLEAYMRDYSPDQPRVPAGSPEGGQWTSGGGGGSGGVREAGPAEKSFYAELTAKEPFKLGMHEAPAEALQSYVVANGKKYGIEWLGNVDGNGAVHAPHTSGEANHVGFDDWEAKQIENPDANLVFHHNHPSGGGLSPADLSQLGMPGVHAIWAHGSEGSEYRAELTDAARNYIKGWGMKPGAALENLYSLADHANQKTAWIMKLYGKTSVEEMSRWHWAVVNSMLHDAGVIDLTTNRDAHAFIDRVGVSKAYKQRIGQVHEEFFHDGKSEAGDYRPYRRTDTLRHPGDVGTAFAQIDQPAAEHLAVEHAGSRPPRDPGEEEGFEERLDFGNATIDVLHNPSAAQLRKMAEQVGKREPSIDTDFAIEWGEGSLRGVVEADGTFHWAPADQIIHTQLLEALGVPLIGEPSSPGGGPLSDVVFQPDRVGEEKDFTKGGTIRFTRAGIESMGEAINLPQVERLAKQGIKFAFGAGPARTREEWLDEYLKEE